LPIALVYFHRSQKILSMKKMLLQQYGYLKVFFWVAASFFVSGTFAQTCDFEQGQNGGVGLPRKSPVDFARGNSNSSKSHFSEGNSVPYRIEIDDLLPNVRYRILISFDVKKSGKYAIDYITGFQNLQTNSADLPEFVNPLSGTSLASLSGLTVSSIAIPAPVFSTSTAFNTKAATSFSNLKTPASFNPETTDPLSTLTAQQRDKGNMVLWNGTLNSIAYISSVNMTPQDVTATIQVEFTKANNTNKVVLAWGGHIASLQDWGQGNSASAISGSPYHMIIENVRRVSNNTLVCNGNMDCQLAADAVTPVPTCSLTGPTLICPNVYPINYTATLDASQNGAVSFQWVLTNQNLSADARLTGTISGTTSASSITGLVTPASPNFTPGGTYLLQLQVIRDGSVGICYLNSATAPGAVVRVNNASLSATANPSSISLNSTSVSSLSASALLDGQPADASFSYDWTAVSPGGLQGGTLSSSTSRTPTFTAVASGTYVFKVRATQQTAPFCVDSALVSVNVAAEQLCPSVPTLPICAQSSGLTYTASSPATAGVNYSWSVNNGSSLQSENGLQSITVNAGAVSFDLSLTLDYLNPLLQNLVCTYPITVNALPAVSTGSYGPYCAGASVVSLSGTPAGGTWSGSGVSGSSFDPSVAGVYSVTYTYTDENGCTASAATSITVNALPVVSTGSYGPYCAGGASVSLGGTPAGGVWSGSGVSGSSFDPAAAGVYSVTYTYTDENGCTASAATSITVNALPVVSTGSYGPYCAGGAAVSLSGSPMGGVWSGIGVSGSSFDPAVAGVYPVTYAYTDENGCSVSASTSITVNALPVVSTGSYGPYCAGGAAVSLSGSPMGGVWSGIGVSGSSFDPAVAGVYSVTYTYTDENGCTASAATSITVNALPVVSTGSYGPYCAGASVVSLSGTPAGGTWSGSGVSGSSFDPAVAGVYSVTYTYTDENGCTASAATSITVNALPVVSTGSYGPYCAGGAAVSLSGSPMGGVWSGVGVSGSSFDPAVAGLYSVTYTYTDENGCTASASTKIVVKNKPVVNAGCYGPVCLNSSPVFLSGTPTGGTWSGPGVAGRSFDPMEAGVGTHILTYTYQVPGGCSLTSTATIEVLALPVVNAGSYAPICINQGLITLVGSPTGGDWSGTGVEGDQFSPITAGVGTHTVVYSYTAVTGCFNSAEAIIVVRECEEPALRSYTQQVADTSLQEKPDLQLVSSNGASRAMDAVSVAKQKIMAPTVRVFPNPYKEVVRFMITTSVTEKVALRLYDINGQLLSLIFEGEVAGGVPKVIDHLMPRTAVPVLYRVSNGRTVTSGLLLPGLQ
jgi:hypothetical protein